MVSFNSVPGALRVPFVTAEFDSSRAQQGAAALPYTALLIGQKIAAGSAAVNSIYRVTRADQVIALAGRGSMLHRMALAYFAANKSTETYIGVLLDNPSAVKASSTVTVAGTATGAGSIALYVGGVRITSAVASGDTAAATATALAAAVNAAVDSAVTAAVVGAVVTLTARNGGIVGNELDVRLNYADGEILPAGITAVATAPTGGTLNPVLTSLISALGDQWFHVIANPYTDATSLGVLETELDSRFGPMRMIDAKMISAKNDTYANVATLGLSRNSKHSVILRMNESPTPPAEYAAHVAGVVAYYGPIDPARPMQTLPLPFIKAPAKIDRDTIEERNILLYDGIATTRVGPGDVVQIERLITTYRLNEAGSPDTAYLDLSTGLNLMFQRYSFRNRMATRYPRHKLANDGTRFGAGQAIITPKLAKAEALAYFREMEELGLLEGFEQFKADLVVERNAQDPNRLDFLLSPDLINSLIVTAAKFQFLL